MSRSKFEDFKRTWEEIIAKIEGEAIDGDGINLIRIQFELDEIHFKIHCKNYPEFEEFYMDMKLLESKLETALQIAHSRFRLRNRGILARFFGGMTEKILKKSKK